MTLKLYLIQHPSNDFWLFQGLVKMLGDKYYTPFSCSVTKISKLSNDEFHPENIEMRIIDGNYIYIIEPILCGIFSDNIRKKSKKIDLIKLKLPESVWMGVIGSIITVL